MIPATSTSSAVIRVRNSKEKLALEILRRLDEGWKKGDLRFNESGKSIPYPIDEDDVLRTLRRITEDEAAHVLDHCSLTTMAEFMATLLNYRQEKEMNGLTFNGLTGEYSPV
ncbi:MAG: hypothetical protein OHK0017_05940 [Patescibacteria group bacterium]